MLVLHIAREAKLVNMVQGGPSLFDQRLEGWEGVNYMELERTGEGSGKGMCKGSKTRQNLLQRTNRVACDIGFD